MASVLSPVAAPVPKAIRLLFGGSLALCLAALLGVASAGPAAAYEHPPIDFDELQMVPERGWGVSGQQPSRTQTETLDVLVWDMVLSGDRMFVGGAFLNVRESKDSTPISQPYLAAFDVVTGDWVDTFTPSFDRAIYALEVLPNGSILVGGEFENVNGTSRRGLVAIDPQTGQIDPSFEGAVDRPWSNRRATVRDLEVESATGRIYVAGSFSHLDGANGSRFSVSKAGRFTDATGTIDRNWRPVVSGGAVWGVDTDPSGGQVAFAGWFSSVNGNSNTRNFHAVDDVTGASMPNKIPWSFNDNSRPEVYDLAYSDDALFLAGSQHYVATVDKTTHRRLAYSYTGNRARGWGWSSQGFGGDYQSAEIIGNYLVTGCHCTNGNNNHYDSITGRVTTFHNVMAYDATTGRHNEAFDVDIESPRDGQWAAASDETGCLWIGGDYHVGGTESGQSRWLGGFARLCPELRSPQIANTGDRVSTLNDAVDLTIEASGNNATYGYTASNLPTGLVMDPTTGLVTGTIAEVGIYEVTVTATIVAGQGLSGSKTFTWTVMDDNPPVVTPIADQVKVAGTSIVIPVTGTDDEGSQLRWTAWGMEGQLTIDSITGEITGKVASSGELTINVKATDIVGLGDIEQFTLTVIDGPSVAGFSNHRNYNSRSDGNYAIGPLVQFDDETILTHLGVHDANRNGQIDNPGPTTVAIFRQSDRQELARVEVPVGAPVEDDFAYAELDQRITLQPNVTYAIAALLPRGGEPFSEFGSLDLAPGVRTVGRAYTVTTTMRYPATQSSDGRNRYFGPGIKIADSTDPSPVVETISDQFNAVDLPVLRPITATSPGGLALTYTATSLPQGLTIDPATGVIGGTPTGEGTSATVVTVTDSLGLTTSRTFDWTILDSDPPAIQPLADRVVLERKPLSIRPVLTEADPNATWTAIGLPTGVSIDETTGVITGKPLDAGTYDVTVTATDLVDLEGEESFQITIIGAPSVAGFSNHRNYNSRSDGNYAIGPLVQFDDETILTHLGVHDANRNGQIDNPGPTTVAIFRQSDRQELARVEIPANTPVEDDFAYAELDQRITLQPNVTYAIAALLPRGGEPFSEFGSLDLAPGVRTVGRAYTGTTTMRYPATQSSDGRNRYFGPGIKILDENVDPTPVIETVGDVFDAVNLAISRQVNATSPAGATLTYAATGLPTGLAIDGATGEITGTPIAEGTFTTIVTVTDSLGLASSETFAWGILDADPPSIIPLSDRVAIEGDSVSIEPVLTEEDPNATWTATGLPDGLDINTETGAITGGGTGTATVYRGSNYSQESWTVGPGSYSYNQIRNEIGNDAISSIRLEDGVTIRACEHDWGGECRTYASSMPNLGSFNDKISSFEVMATSYPEQGRYDVTVSATDLTGLVDDETFALIVIEAPAVDAVQSLENFATQTGSYFLGPQIEVDKRLKVTEFGVHDADRDGQISNSGSTTIVLYDVDGGREMARVNVPAGTPVENNFAYAPLASPIFLDPGETYLLASEISGEPYAQDGDLTLADGVRIVGYGTKSGSSAGFPGSRGNRDRNQYFGPSFRFASETAAPTIESIDDRFDATDLQAELQVNATSPAGLALTYTAQNLPVGMAIDEATGAITGTPTTEGTSSTVVTATDSLGLVSSETFTWSILDADPPTIEPIADSDAADGDFISIRPELTVDDPQIVWSADGLPDGATINPETGVISGTVRGGGAFTVTVTATDLIGLQGTQTFTLNIAGPFIVSESTWRYDDSGQDLGTAWRAPDFDDGQWSTGQAALGFSNDVVTTLNRDNITYYARKSFEFSGAAPSSLALRLKADDGAVVYLNGVEILRDNMPDGIITANTTAVEWRIGDDEDFKDHTVSAARLVEGTNVIAVEVHNVDRANNDLSFDLSLAPSSAQPVVDRGPMVAAGSGWQSFQSIDDNPAGWPSQPLGGAARSAELGFGDGDEVTELTKGEEAYFFTHEFEFNGEIPAGLDLQLKADDGAVVYLNGVEVLRDNMPDGTITANTTAVDWRGGDDEQFKAHVISSAPLVEGSNLIAVQVHNVWRSNNDLSFDLELAPSDQAGPAPVVAVDAQDDDELLAAGSTWNYADSSAGSAPAGWPGTAIGGDSGPAEFGFGDGDEATTLNGGQEAYYFTRSFNVDDPAGLAEMTMELAVDDGAVVYLNGIEIYRLNMPDGTIQPTSRPLTWRAGADETMKTYVVPADALQAGSNLVAVEVHNLWPGNSDLSFDLALSRR